MEQKTRARSRKSELKPKIIEEPVIVSTITRTTKKRNVAKRPRRSESELSTISSASEGNPKVTCVYCNNVEALRKGYKFKKCLKCESQAHSKCIKGPKDKFICNRCSEMPQEQPNTRKAKHENNNMEDGFAGFSDLEVEESRSFNNHNEEIGDVIKDIAQETQDEPKLEELKEWTVLQVFDYLHKYFPKHAHLFKDQEIDGSSLYLMGRSDILTGFGLKLGPAMAIYQKVAMMKKNTNDIRITWE